MRGWMQSRWWIGVLFIVCGVTAAAVQKAEGGAERHAGVWSGTWDGAGSGGFELTIESGTGGAATGRLSVTGDPSYKATIKTISFDGNRMKARYDFPPDESAEVVLEGTFEEKSAKGTWSLREKAGGTEAAAGTWTVSRK